MHLYFELYIQISIFIKPQPTAPVPELSIAQ
jgi:hypothetical protein